MAYTYLKERAFLFQNNYLFPRSVVTVQNSSITQQQIIKGKFYLKEKAFP